ncbi:MAG: DNA polymerase III subunit alpha [Phycisphaerae bacterium]
MSDFTHLHVHSHYSLLDGGNRINDLVSQAAKLGMSHLAITDHGNLFGAVDFHNAAVAAGIKPILGLEAYISPTTRDDRSMSNQRTACYHLLLLAMNPTGWQNIMKLSSRAFLEGFYYKPRIDRELLSECSEGVICTTACLGGEVPSALLEGREADARRIAGEYRDIFGPDRFFIEIQKQGIEDQDRANPGLVAIAKDLGVGLVGTNDVHFLTRDDKPAHEVLTCISTGKTLGDDSKMAYPPELYLKSGQEMAEALKDWPEAIANTRRIAEMCDVSIDFSEEHLPVFPVPQGQTDDDHLAEIAWGGLRERFEERGEEIPEEYRQRLDRELEVIRDKGYSSYFLIVNDFVKYARSNHIPSSPRGSGVGTLLGYCLRLQEVDPIRYGLLFERFTDPARKEAPDLDIDICQDGRGKVIRYVREKYGHVAQIITYGTLKARAAIRDVGRVLDVPLPKVDEIAKLVPEGPKVTLARAMESEPDLKKLYNADGEVREVIDNAARLEGLARHSGIHAAGVIICDEPLENFVPLCRASDSEDAVTQWDGPTCDAAGLMKMDFLGLRTLTILQRACDLATESSGEKIDAEKLPLDDPAVFELFCKGHTDGVFQFESDGMKGVLMQMQPGRIEDLIAANAMYRPGPMELIPTYCNRKFGREEVPSVHALVDDLLAETYGIMTYQEQVMQVLNRLGKLPLARALTLIKAISKKKEKVIAAEKPNFIDGCVENGIDRDEAEELFALIQRFAGYGFNKSHSTQYAILAYKTAYMKVHYPREFLAATLTYECSDTDKVVQYMSEADRMGVKILPPDVNTCGPDFAIDGEAVRFGLSAVKGVGHRAVEAIVEARQEVGKFTDLYHFCEFVDLRSVNRSTIETLIKCGAFDSMGASRAAMIAGLENAISLGQSAAEDRRSGQMSFFGGGGLGDFSATPERPRFPDVPPWSESQLLAAEKETLGFYITSHPLVKYAREMAGLAQPPGFELARAEDHPDQTQVVVGCMIQQVRPTFTKKDNRKMAMLTVEDVSGKCDAVVFPRTYEQVADLIRPEAIVFLKGTIDRKRERPSILVDEMIPVDMAVAKFAGSLKLSLPPGFQEKLGDIREALATSRGNVPVYLEMSPTHRMDVRATVLADREWFVQPTRELMDRLQEVLGDQQHFTLTPRRLDPPKRRRNWGPNRKANGQNGVASEAVTRFN